MSHLSKKIKQINGPVNVVRLEGEFKGIKKVLYVFMDFHIPTCAQTACDNVFRKDIDGFFAESFHNLNSSSKTYDFFFETWEMTFENIKYGLHFESKKNYKDRYIEEIYKLFRKLFTYESDKVQISKLFTNIRLHYLDIRVLFEQPFYLEIHKMIDMAYDMRTHFYIHVPNLSIIINFMNDFVKHFQMITSIIEDIKTNNKKPIEKVNVIEFQKKINENLEERERKETAIHYYLINKMYHKYNHDEIRLYVQREFGVILKNLNELIVNSEKAISEFMNISKTVEDANNNLENDLYQDPNTGHYNYGLPFTVMYDMSEKVYLTLIEISNALLWYFTKFMDVYFIRRFMDKDYITNGIAYTGAAHSLVYINRLCKIFDFKITHFHYSKISNLEELNDVIKKKETNDLAGELGLYFYPPILSQCSDITNFPNNFE